jgi:hypothetical protein
LKAKYSPDFSAAYNQLSPEIQRRFQKIDRRVQADDLSALDHQGWASFVDLDKNHTAFGIQKEKEDVFYWLLLCSPQSRPIVY